MVGRIARVKWAAHGKEISAHLFSIFKNTDAESDCLLSCAGGRLFPAHRIVLAMASPFFSTIFDSVPPNAVSPLIVLDGVEADQVEALMQYMYSGYSIVKCEKLPALCRTAKALGIKEFPSLEIAPPVKRPIDDKIEVEITSGKNHLLNDGLKKELGSHHSRGGHLYQNNSRNKLEVLSDSRNIPRKLDSGLSTGKIVEPNFQISQLPLQSSNYHHSKTSNPGAKRFDTYPIKFTQIPENPQFHPNEFVIPRKSSGASYGKPIPDHATSSKVISSFENSRLREALHSPATSQHSRRQWNCQVEPKRIKLEEAPVLVDVCGVSDDEGAQETGEKALTSGSLPRREHDKLQKSKGDGLPKASPVLPVQKLSERCIAARSATEPAIRSASPPSAVSPTRSASHHRPNSLPSMAVQHSPAQYTMRKLGLPQSAGPQNLDAHHQKSNGSAIQNDKRSDSGGSGNSIIYVPKPVYPTSPYNKMAGSCSDFSYVVSPFGPREPEFERAKSENMLKEDSSFLKEYQNDKEAFFHDRARHMHVRREQNMSNCGLELDAKGNQFYKQRPPALLQIVNGEPSSSSDFSPSGRPNFPSEFAAKTCSDEVYKNTYQCKNISSISSSDLRTTSITAPDSHSFSNESKAVSSVPNAPSVDIIQLYGKCDKIPKSNGEKNDASPPTSDSSLFNHNVSRNVPYTNTCSMTAISESANNSSVDYWKPPEQNSLQDYGEISDSSPEHGANDPLLTKISTTKRRRVRGPKSWEFLLRLLRDPTTNPSLIRWENESEGVFRLVKPDAIALRWGKRTGKHFTEMLSYENFARGLRYHYVTGALSAVSERCFVYKFGPKAESVLKSPEKLYDFPV